VFTATTATKKVLGLRKRIRAVAGGTSASKTISILLVLIDIAQSSNSALLITIVSESLPHLKRGAMRDFENIMQEHGYFQDRNWNKTDSIYTFPNGSKIEFFGADSPDKLRGPRRDILYINEANNVPFSAFEQLEVRTKKTIFLDWNPTSEFWFYTDVMPSRTDSIDFITLTYKDNEALDENIVASIESRKTNMRWWRVYGEGQLGEADDMVYNGWQIIDEIPHEARLERYGLDFGYTNHPTAIIAVHKHNGGYILDEICYQKGLLNNQIAAVIKNVPPALVKADSAEPKSIDELNLYGVNILPCVKGQGSVNQGIQLVQEHKISVTKRSINLIKEYRSYMWQTDKNGKITNDPIDINNHLMDALRYAFEGLIVSPFTGNRPKYVTYGKR
jgi:phage terminase large subunit